MPCKAAKYIKILFLTSGIFTSACLIKADYLTCTHKFKSFGYNFVHKTGFENGVKDLFYQNKIQVRISIANSLNTYFYFHKQIINLK